MVPFAFGWMLDRIGQSFLWCISLSSVGGDWALVVRGGRIGIALESEEVEQEVS